MLGQNFLFWLLYLFFLWTQTTFPQAAVLNCLSDETENDFVWKTKSEKWTQSYSRVCFRWAHRCSKLLLGMFQNVQSLNKSSGKQTENSHNNHEQNLSCEKLDPKVSAVVHLHLDSFGGQTMFCFYKKKLLILMASFLRSAGSSVLSLPSSLALLPAYREPRWMSSVGGDGCWAASPSLHQANVIKRYLASKWRWLRPLQLTDEHPGRRLAVAASSLLVYIQEELMEATGRHFIHGLSRNSNKTLVMN